MLVSRRQILLAGTVGLTSVALSGCRSIEQAIYPVTDSPDLPVQNPKMSTASALRVLSRVSFGHRPGDVGTLQTLGYQQYVDRQLVPDTIVESEILLTRLRPFGDSLPDDYGLLYEIDDHELIVSLSQATLLRAVYSNRSLYERMVEFWSDHFNIFAFKSLGLPQFTVLYNNEVLRKYALTNFRALLGASVQSAALLSYLDNEYNHRGRPNENYARELMELHTLGVHGGYTQHDVANVAKCLTGWTIDRKWRPGSFNFKDSDHDQTTKYVLSRQINAGGKAEMDEVLDMLADHPSTAKHVATKLLMRFRGDSTPDHVDHVASVFLSSSGDIKKTVRAVLVDCGIFDAPPIFKRPFDYMSSSLRALDADTDGSPSLAGYLATMGQPLFQWPRPDGYTDKSKSWVNSLAARWQFALDLSAGRIQNTSVNWANLAPGAMPAEVLHRIFGTQSLTTTAYSLPETAALALMSPEFQWR
jgi:uncharacterized protein (DUF1800 family)